MRSDSRQETREQSRPQTRPVTTPKNIRETDERRETDETKYETKYTKGGDRTICICGGNLAGARTTFVILIHYINNPKGNDTGPYTREHKSRRNRSCSAAGACGRPIYSY